MYFMSGLVLFAGPWRPGSNNYYPTSVVYLVGGTLVLLLGLYFLRGAPLLMRFAYGNESGSRHRRVQSTICPKSYANGRPTSHSNCMTEPTHPDFEQALEGPTPALPQARRLRGPGTARDYPSTS